VRVQSFEFLVEGGKGLGEEFGERMEGSRVGEGGGVSWGRSAGDCDGGGEGSFAGWW